MTKLRLAEIGDDVPGVRIHQREHFHTGPGEGALRYVHVDYQARERRCHTAVTEIQLRRVHGRFSRSYTGIDALDRGDGIRCAETLAAGLMQRRLGGNMLCEAGEEP